MASAKGTTTRRASSSRSPKRKDDEHHVSPARWAGVAFVIVAIVAAVVLGMVSPSDPSPQTPGAPADVAEASPTPIPTTLDTRVPVAQPVITNPIDGMTKEIDFPVTVDLPDEELPKRLLRLYTISGENDIVGELDKPKPGTKVTVPSVRVDTGEHVLTAVLDGPAGWGPRSEPLYLTVDRNAPDLAITKPKNKHSTYESKIVIEGTSEVGADVVVTNETLGNSVQEVVGNSGTFDVVVRLKKGVTNKIVATSRDQAEVKRTATVRVTRLDGVPRVKIKQVPAVKRSSLPAKLRIVVYVTDAKGKPIPEAQVDLTLGAPDRTALAATEFTNADGRAVWRPTDEPSSSTADALELAVTVTSPLSGDSKQATQTIEFR